MDKEFIYATYFRLFYTKVHTVGVDDSSGFKGPQAHQIHNITDKFYRVWKHPDTDELFTGKPTKHDLLHIAKDQILKPILINNSIIHVNILIWHLDKEEKIQDPLLEYVKRVLSDRLLIDKNFIDYLKRY